MLQPPSELLPHVQDNRLNVVDGIFNNVEAFADYLQKQRNLTHIAISQDAEIANLPDGTSGVQALALAVQRGRSPNLLDVSIAGGHYVPQLAAIADGNYRSAAELLRLARDPSHALSKNECERIAERLPAMLAVAEAHGAVSTEHSMTRLDLADTLERIRDHASQHNVAVGVDEHIARLRPMSRVTAVDRTYMISSGATRSVV